MLSVYESLQDNEPPFQCYVLASDFEVSLFIDNTVKEKGNTKNVLDNPLNAVLWLINTLCTKGEPLLKNQFIFLKSRI